MSRCLQTSQTGEVANDDRSRQAQGFVGCQRDGEPWEEEGTGKIHAVELLGLIPELYKKGEGDLIRGCAWGDNGASGRAEGCGGGEIEATCRVCSHILAMNALNLKRGIWR